MSLESVAEELYGLPLGEFTAARNARAKTEPAAKRLPKPSAAAWAINQFARRRGDQLDQVFSLGEQLRDAQDELDAAALRALGSQRRTLVSAMAKQVASLASELENSIGASAVLEIEQSLHAAMADPRAASALRSGRLIRSLSTDGLDEVNLDGAVAGAVPPTPTKKPGTTAAQKRKLQKAVEDAEAADHEATEAAEEASNRSEEAAQLTTELERAVSDLTARLADARDQLSESRVAAKRLAAEKSSSTTAAERAAERLAEARAKL